MDLGARSLELDFRHKSRVREKRKKNNKILMVCAHLI